MALLAARAVSSFYSSNLAVDGVWNGAGGLLAVRLLVRQPEAAPNIPGFGAINIPATILRMQVSAAPGVKPAKGDTFTIGTTVWTVTGAPRHHDAHQLEWHIEVSP